MIDLFDEKDRTIYIEAMTALQNAGVNFMLGGAFAVYKYTGWWRNTHDVDVYTLREQVPEAISALSSAGFSDLGEQAKDDNKWIYHACKDSVIFDVIWRSANLEHYITEDWLKKAPQNSFLGMDLLFLPLEELIWMKMFVINRHRCDWSDNMRIIKAQCGNVDWNHLLKISGGDWLLLAAMIDVFDWLHPDSVNCIPPHIRADLAKRRLEYHKNPVAADREHLLDPWIHQRKDIYAAGSNE